MTAPLVMALVALVCAGAAVIVILRPATGDASIYRHRIASTMLAAGAIILAAFAWTLHGWDTVG